MSLTECMLEQARQVQRGFWEPCRVSNAIAARPVQGLLHKKNFKGIALSIIIRCVRITQRYRYRHRPIHILNQKISVSLEQHKTINSLPTTDYGGQFYSL